MSAITHPCKDSTGFRFVGRPLVEGDVQQVSQAQEMSSFELIPDNGTVLMEIDGEKWWATLRDGTVIDITNLTQLADDGCLQATARSDSVPFAVQSDQAEDCSNDSVGECATVRQLPSNGLSRTTKEGTMSQNALMGERLTAALIPDVSSCVLTARNRVECSNHLKQPSNYDCGAVGNSQVRLAGTESSPVSESASQAFESLGDVPGHTPYLLRVVD